MVVSVDVAIQMAPACRLGRLSPRHLVFRLAMVAVLVVPVAAHASTFAHRHRPRPRPRQAAAEALVHRSAMDAQPVPLRLAELAKHHVS